MNYWKWKLQWQMWMGNKGTYRALEDVDSMGENGRAWGIEGLAREPQGLEGPICKSNNLGEACWNSSCQAHSLSLSLLQRPTNWNEHNQPNPQCAGLLVYLTIWSSSSCTCTMSFHCCFFGRYSCWSLLDTWLLSIPTITSIPVFLILLDTWRLAVFNY